MHDWPATRRNFMATAPSSAALKSASSNTMKGALPPSSNDSRLIWRAAVSMIPFPTSVEPVKPIFRMSGWVSSSAPTRPERLVVSTLKTPAGSPASSATFAIASAVSGVADAGLRTTVHPAARAGAILRVTIVAGKFHGVTAATGPTGWRNTQYRFPGWGEGIHSPVIRRASSANQPKYPSENWTSFFASSNGLPFSRVTSRARSSRRSSMSSWIRSRNRPRSLGARADQSRKAVCAAATARPTSGTAPLVTLPTTVPAADQLHAERQAVRAPHERHAERRHAAERPQRAEGGIPGRAEPLWRGAGGGGRHDGVVALGEQLGEARVELGDAGQRAEIVERAHVPATLKPRAKRLGQPGPPRLPLPAEIRRHLRFHDDPVPLGRFFGGIGELHRLHALAEVTGQLGEGLLGVRVDTVPTRRPHECEHRWQRRLLGGHVAVRDARARARIRVTLVVTDDQLHEEREILDGAREQADMVERAREPEHPVARDEAMRRLQAVDAAERRRPDRRAAGLAAECHRHHAGRHGRGRAARGSAGRVRGVVRVPCLARRADGELRRDRLAHDHRPGGAQHRHHAGVTRRRAAGAEHRPVLGGHIGGVDGVLYSHPP